jgi:receptor expression-enhancing protein 5/6
MSMAAFLSDFGIYCTNLVITFIKFAYPMYGSYKALRTQRDDDDRFWMIYWTILGLESFVEAYVVPFLCWIPFFMIARVLFYLWLQIPIFNGSVIIFKKWVQPYFEKTRGVFGLFVSGIHIEPVREGPAEEFKQAYDEILVSLTQF